MKFLAFVLIVSFGLAYGATTEELTASLLKRGQTLVASTNKAIEDIHKTGHEHLLAAVHWQLNQVQDYIGLLSPNADHPLTQPILDEVQLKLIDAGFAYTENRLEEELAIVKEYIAHPKHEAGTTKDLATHAKELVVKAGSVIRADGTAHHQPSIEHSYVLNDISYEIRSIQTAVAALEHKAQGADARKEIETLERNQISLNALLKRIGVNHAFF